MSDHFFRLTTLALGTLKSLFRDRILYNVLFVSVFLLLVGYWASLLVYGNQHRVMLHLGMMVIALSILGVAISLGGKVLKQEIDSRQIYLVLSKPVSRLQVWAGKSLGVGIFLALNLFFLSMATALGVHLTGGRLTIAFLQACSLLWIEAWMIFHFALTLSLYFSNSITLMLSVTVLFLSHNYEQIVFLDQAAAPGASLLVTLSHLIPRGDQFLLDTRVYYELSLSQVEWLKHLGHGMAWSMIYFVIGHQIFKRKNL